MPCCLFGWMNSQNFKKRFYMLWSNRFPFCRPLTGIGELALKCWQVRCVATYMFLSQVFCWFWTGGGVCTLFCIHWVMEAVILEGKYCIFVSFLNTRTKISPQFPSLICSITAVWSKPSGLCCVLDGQHCTPVLLTPAESSAFYF